MTTVEQRLRLRAYYAKQGWTVRCAKCKDRIDHSFDIQDDEPVHYTCAAAARIKATVKLRATT